MRTKLTLTTLLLCLVWLKTARIWVPLPEQTIADSATIKAALQTLETAVESKGSATSLTSLTTAVGDLNTLTGVSQNDTNLGTFTGSTISDNVGIKSAIQALETAVETKHATGGNVNLLSANTSADSEPAGWHFLAVDYL